MNHQELSLSAVLNCIKNIYKPKYRLIYAVLLISVTRFVYNKLYRYYHSLPPGPENTFIPKYDVWLKILFFPSYNINLAIKYGEVFSFYTGNTLRIHINDSSIAKQVLSSKNTLHRSEALASKDTFNIIAAADNTPTFAVINGEKWSKIRSIMHSKLIGVLNTKFVNEIVNKYISNILQANMDQIISNKRGIWYPRELLTELSFYVIFYANCGHLDFENVELYKELATDLSNTCGFDNLKRAMILCTLPKIAKILPKSYFDPVYQLRQRINDNIQIMIKQKNKNKKENEDDDLTFMDRIAELVDDDDFEYNESQQIADIFVMFLAGTDTTSLTIEWGLILLAKEENIQNKIRTELISVLVKNNINYKDSSNIIYDIHLLLQLPLFRALIHEILRISCVSRMGVHHCITKNDIWIKTKKNKKYRLPKNSMIKYNVECMCYNNIGGEHWTKYTTEYPQKICLENWLKNDSDNNELKFQMNESLLVFGHGKRDCIGRQLAIKEIRIILGYFLLNYKFTLSEKYKNMQTIKSKGIFGAKPTPQIPVIVSHI